MSDDIEQRARELLDALPGPVDPAAWANGYGDGWNDYAKLAHDELLPVLVSALASQAQVPGDVRRDAERLDWLEGFVRKAYFYDGSFDFAKSSEGERGGYRFMSRNRLGQRHSTIRQAIDAAMAVPPTLEEADRA